MPKRKLIRSRRRRRIKRRQRRRNPLYRSLPAVRKKATVKFRYATTVPTLTSTAGGLVKYDFSANGCYDPDQTGIGHQPFGWDQWTVFFNHYAVIASKIRCYWTTDGTANAKCGIYLSDDNASYLNAADFIEAKRGSFSIINQQRSSAKTSSTFSMRRFFNIKDAKDNYDKLGSPVNANPTDQATYSLWYESEGTTTSSVAMVVVIEYIVAFSEPKDISTS